MNKIIHIILLLIFAIPMLAQSSGSYYNPKDDQYRLLGLKRAKELFETAEADYIRQKELFGKGFIAQKDLDRAYSVYADAEVNYQQALLAVVFEKQYVSVIGAVKFQEPNGKIRVRLTLGNTSEGGAEYQHLLNIEDELFQSLKPEVVHDVYVSLLNEQNAIISQPYEAKIERLLYGEPQTIEFTLLQDLDAVIVNIVYGSGTQRAPKIYLQKDESANRVIIQTIQFSQEAELGGTATFDMTLELYSGSENTFKLEVVNLPQQINRYFVDPTSRARISQFKFTQSVNTRDAALQINLPDRTSSEISIDTPMQFFVLAIPYDRLDELGDIKSRTFTESEIKALDIGYQKLELLPRGKGILIVKAPQLYFSILPGEEIEVPINLVNEGTRRIDNIEFELDVPLNWQKSVEPLVIESLDIRDEKRAVLKFTPPDDVSVGKYEMRLKTTAYSNNQPIKAEDKTISVSIAAEANIRGPGARARSGRCVAPRRGWSRAARCRLRTSRCGSSPRPRTP